MHTTIRSRATGAAFLSGFGTLWLVSGAVASGTSLAVICALVALGVALLALSLLMARGLPTTTSDNQQPERARIMRWFKWANIAQYIAIGAIIIVANLADRPDIIPAGISIVVALHFLPLAYALHNPLQYATAACILAWDTACLIIEPHTSTVPVAIGTGTALSITAAIQLWICQTLRARLRTA